MLDDGSCTTGGESGGALSDHCVCSENVLPTGIGRSSGGPGGGQGTGGWNSASSCRSPKFSDAVPPCEEVRCNCIKPDCGVGTCRIARHGWYVPANGPLL